MDLLGPHTQCKTSETERRAAARGIESYSNRGHSGSIFAFINYKTKNKFRTRNYLPTNVICIETIEFEKKMYFLNYSPWAIFQVLPVYLFLVTPIISTLKPESGCEYQT